MRSRAPLCRVLRMSSTRSVVLRAATRRDVAAVSQLQRAASLTEPRLIPDIAGTRLDEREARRHWRRTIAHPRRRLFVAAQGAEVLGASGVDLIVSIHRLAHVRRTIYLHSLFVAPPARCRARG